MKKSKIFTAVALSIGLSTFASLATAGSHMAGYDRSVEYGQYRTTESAYALRASDIIGADLKNAAGDDVGEIDDLIVSRDDKLMAIVSAGGFLGMGERLIQVPYEMLRIGKEAGEVFWDVDKAALEKMTAFEYEKGEPSGYDIMVSRRMARSADMQSEKAGYDEAVDYAQFRSEDSTYKLRVSELLGEEIENTAGEEIGEVDDLVMPRTGDALQAVVSVGGFLGMGEKLVSLPYSELRVGVDGDELYLASTKEGLEAKPAFTYNEGETTGMKMLNERRRYRQDVKAGLAEAEETASRFKESLGYTEARSAESLYHLRMSEVIGEDVKNANDEAIGEVDDLVMSRKDDVLMAIISVGGFLGMGDKLISVPYNELRISKDGDDIYIDSTKEALEAHAEFKYNEGEMSGKTSMQERMKDE